MSSKRFKLMTEKQKLEMLHINIHLFSLFAIAGGGWVLRHLFHKALPKTTVIALSFWIPTMCNMTLTLDIIQPFNPWFSHPQIC